MQKIIIVTNNLETGGVQTSLINLLKEIHNDYDVTLLTFFYRDEYRAKIPGDVNVITVKSPFKHLGMSSNNLKRKPFGFIARTIWWVITKLFGRSFTIKIMSLFQKKISGYDVAISFLHEGSPKSLYGGCNEFVLNKVVSEKKIGWLHCDFELCGANNESSRKIYKKFDRIVACSEGCKKVFLKCMPEFSEKCVAIRNCNDFEMIKSLAKDAYKYDDLCFNIVTVARLSAEKGIERAIQAVKYCVDHGENIKYHIIGGGPQYALLKEIVENSGLSDRVFFYGNQANPYKYMANADLFMLTSYHEAAPMVFDEAACLGVPVLATKTTSTDEMIIESGNGFVCENNQDDINDKLLCVINDIESLEKVGNNLNSKAWDNVEIKKRFKEIIG